MQGSGFRACFEARPLEVDAAGALTRPPDLSLHDRSRALRPLSISHAVSLSLALSLSVFLSRSLYLSLSLTHSLRSCFDTWGDYPIYKKIWGIERESVCMW